MTDTALQQLDHYVEADVDMGLGDPSGRDVCTIHRQSCRRSVLAGQTRCVLDIVPASNFLQLPETPYPAFVSHELTQVHLLARQN